MSLKTYGQFIQTDFLQNLVAYAKIGGHVLIFYPTQLKLSGSYRTKCPKFDQASSTGGSTWLTMVKNG